jgi:predicted RNase H-like HicB family nuclease
MDKKLNIIIWQEGNIYVAQSLEYGIASQGSTHDEALQNIKEAIELYLQDDSGEKANLYNLPEVTKPNIEQITIQSLNLNV